MGQTFEGKVVVVTGANSGIGEAAAVAFAKAGAKVYGIARRKEAVEAMRKQHPEVRWLLADVASAADITAAIESVAKEAGAIDVLVNNAAIFSVGPLAQTSEAQVRSQFEVNVFGATFAAMAALPSLKASRGTIVNISSAAGHKPAAGAAIYGATKAALESLTRSWALELAPDGVRVNAVAPGPTDTPVFEKTPMPAEALKAAFVAKVPLGRIATTAEVVHWIVAVADPAVTWMTGHVLDIDGGMSLT